MNNNLSLIGYRMPAEWELQESVWIAWPYNKSDWPGLFKNIPKIVTQIISELSRSQKINLLINNYNDKKKIINLLSKFPNNLQNIIFYKITTNRIWLRDSGPIYIINEKTKKKLIVNFKFNAWSKYKDYKKDNNINNKLSKLTKVKKIDPVVEINNKSKQLVLEGGAIDVNGKGSVLLTKECLFKQSTRKKSWDYKKIIRKNIKQIFKC